MAVTVMKRYELKYTLDAAQTDFLRERLRGHMEVDQYGKTSIASLYYDTPSYQLIRTSVEKPEFKEKIRLRSYGLATDESPVFLELKRKAYGIVYKRRVQTTIPLVKKFFSAEGDICAPGQINREITAFRDHYRTLVPSCMIIYDRVAYFEPDGDLRLTIDENPRYRTNDLTLTKSMDGISLLDEGSTILEIKVQEAMPLWLCEILSAGGIRKSSFSKYGEAYRQQLLKAQNF
ncbi:MAG: polyphosphate polymerase domain-containing protein [Clostridia bacterium]|nr:polyphosphate polymerase domain-containing protein [Clostridia bacterium]MBR7032327.1 polyphosphate polymerase domain-containing protein [Clostridia bacterium]